MSGATQAAHPSAASRQRRWGQRDEPQGEDEQLWAAVTDPSRRRELDLIRAPGEATPTTLAAELPVTRQAVAKHLAVLARAGLIEAHRHGHETRYTTVYVPKTSSTSCHQAVFVDQASGVGLPSDTVPV